MSSTTFSSKAASHPVNIACRNCKHPPLLIIIQLATLFSQVSLFYSRGKPNLETFNYTRVTLHRNTSCISPYIFFYKNLFCSPSQVKRKLDKRTWNKDDKTAKVKSQQHYLSARFVSTTRICIQKLKGYHIRK